MKSEKTGKIFRRFVFESRYKKDTGVITIRFASIEKEYEKIIAKTALLGGLRIGDINIQRTEVEMENRDDLPSPLVVKGRVVSKIQGIDGRDLFLNPMDQRFVKNVTNNAIERYEALLDRHYSGTLEILPLWQRGNIYHFYDNHFIMIYPATYKITAEPSMIDFLMDTGLGSNTTQGCGFLKVVEGAAADRLLNFNQTASNARGVNQGGSSPTGTPGQPRKTIGVFLGFVKKKILKGTK